MIENLPVKVDDVGRIVIPKKIRKRFAIKTNDYLLLTATLKEIIIKKEDNDIKYKKLLTKLEEVSSTFSFDIIVVKNDIVTYTTSSYNSFKNQKIAKSFEKSPKEIVFSKSTLLLENIYLQTPHCYCAISLESYSEVLIFLIFKKITEKSFAETILKLFQ